MNGQGRRGASTKETKTKKEQTGQKRARARSEAFPGLIRSPLVTFFVLRGRFSSPVVHAELIFFPCNCASSVGGATDTKQDQTGHNTSFGHFVGASLDPLTHWEVALEASSSFLSFSTSMAFFSLPKSETLTTNEREREGRGQSRGRGRRTRTRTRRARGRRRGRCRRETRRDEKKKRRKGITGSTLKNGGNLRKNYYKLFVYYIIFS